MPLASIRASKLPRRVARVVVALAVVLAAGCGDDAEDAFREATRKLAEAQTAYDAADAQVDERRAAMQAAEGELSGALERLDEARKRLDEAREAAGRFATDPVLFRSVQTRLLECDDLEDVAIEARVEKGVVTLSGTVDDAELAARAAELARKTPGVVDVENRIVVLAPATD